MNRSISLDRDDLMRLLLQLVRKTTSAAHDGGLDEWLSKGVDKFAKVGGGA